MIRSSLHHIAAIDESINPNSSDVNDFVAVAGDLSRPREPGRNFSLLIHSRAEATTEYRMFLHSGCDFGDTYTRCSFFSLPNINHESFQGCAQPGILPERASIRQNGWSTILSFFFFLSLYPHREICSSPNGSLLLRHILAVLSLLLMINYIE